MFFLTRTQSDNADDDDDDDDGDDDDDDDDFPDLSLHPDDLSPDLPLVPASQVEVHKETPTGEIGPRYWCQ